MKTLLNGTFGSFWLGIFPHYGFIDKRFLEIQETLRRVSFFVGDFGELCRFYRVFLHVGA
jgi:hypothetical protein